MEWKQREAEPERRCYTMDPEGGGKDHKTRNLALDVEKSKKHRFPIEPPEAVQPITTCFRLQNYDIIIFYSFKSLIL